MGSTRETPIDIFTNLVVDGELILYPSNWDIRGCISGRIRREDPCWFQSNRYLGRKGSLPNDAQDRLTFEKYAIIELKKELMTFEVEGARVIQPLDLYQGPRFTKPTNDKEEPGMLDQQYRTTTGKREDYINQIAEGSVRA